MNNSYNEEMDVLINDFNTELKNILGDKNIEELGIVDLRRLKGQFETLNELNQDLRDRVKESSGITLENVAPKKDFGYLSKDIENLAFDMHDYNTIRSNYHYTNDEAFTLSAIEKSFKDIIEKYKDDIPALAELSNQFPKLKDFMSKDQKDLIEEHNRGQEFAELRIKSFDLQKDNRVSLEEIDRLIAIKKALFSDRRDEKRRLREEKRDNLTLLSNYQKTFIEIKNNNELSNKEGILADYQELIDNLKERNRKIDERLEQINNDFDAIIHGGPISQIEEIKEETTGLKEEEVKNAIDEINKQAFTEEEIQTILNNDREERIMLFNSLIEKDKKDIESTRSFLESQKAYLAALKNTPNTEEEQKRIEESIKKLESNLSEMEERLQEHENELASFNSNEKVEEKKEEIETLDEPIIEATVSTDEPVEEEIETLDESKTDEPVEEEKEVLDEPKEEKTDEEKKEPETIDLGLESFTPPVYEAGSLGALRKSGKLPQNLSGRKLIEICKSLGMNTTDLHYKPSITELQRLTNDKDIKLAFTNLNILSKHEKQLERFDKVLQSYDKLDTEGLDNNFAHRVEVESNKVRSDILEYEAKAKEMLAGSVLEHTSSQHIKNRLEALDAKSDKFNDKLKEQYQKLDAEMKAEKNTKIKQMFSDYRIRKMEKKIDSLSKKQNKVSGKQFEIMNEQTDKYIEKRTKDLLKYQEKQKKTENKIAQVNELMKQREALAEEIKKHEADLENTTGTKLVDRIERSQLNRAKGKLEREVERLDKKINRSNKQAQVSLTWSEAMARTDDGATLTR